jgi:hypothetical protein
MYHELTNRRKDEKNIGYVESHDQALGETRPLHSGYG